MTGTRVGHWQWWSRWLTSLWIGELGWGQNMGIEAQIGERGVDEGLYELARQQVCDVCVEERARRQRFPNDMM